MAKELDIRIQTYKQIHLQYNIFQVHFDCSYKLWFLFVYFEEISLMLTPRAILS